MLRFGLRAVTKCDLDMDLTWVTSSYLTLLHVFEYIDLHRLIKCKSNNFWYYVKTLFKKD